MIEAHTLDAWTRRRTATAGRIAWRSSLGGFAAPAFLFLAGVALALAAASRAAARRHAVRDVAAMARRRGWQIFGLAFLFRLQSLLISGGRFPQSLLKVDILNVMGLAMVMAGALWALVPRPARASRVPDRRVGGVRADDAGHRAAARGSGRCPTRSRCTSGRFPAEPASRCSRGRHISSLAWSVGSWLATPDARRGVADQRGVWGCSGCCWRPSAGLATLLPPFAGQPTPGRARPPSSVVRLGLVMLAVPIARAWHERRAAVMVAAAGVRRGVALRLLDSRGDGLRTPVPGDPPRPDLLARPPPRPWR